MTYRSINTAIWEDPWFEELSPQQKILFFYLVTNKTCTSAGVYEISVKRIAFDTGLDKAEVEQLLRSFNEDKTWKVRWFPHDSVIIVKNFMRYQSCNKQFVQSAFNVVLENYPQYLQLFIEANQALFDRYEIEYRSHLGGLHSDEEVGEPDGGGTPLGHKLDDSDTQVGPPTHLEQVQVQKQEQIQVQETEYMNCPVVCETQTDGTEHPPPENQEKLKDQTEEKPILTVPVRAKDRESASWGLVQSHVDELKTTFPELDVVSEARKAKGWIEANPDRKKTKRGMPRFLFNWMSRAVERLPRGQPPPQKQDRRHRFAEAEKHKVEL